jgi:hypothetical protein
VDVNGESGMTFDEQNPFASGADGRPERSSNPRREGDAVPFDIVAILTRCWELFTANIVLVLAASFVPFVVAMAFTAVSVVLAILGEFFEDLELVFTLLEHVTDIVTFLVSLFFQLGAMRIFINLARGIPADVGMLLGESRNYLSGFGITLVLTGATLLGLLMCIVPGIVVGVGLQFSLYCLLDRDSSMVDAIQESWVLTDGYKLQILLINILVILGSLLVFCSTCGLGYLGLGPGIALFFAVMYDSLVALNEKTD